MDISNLVEGLRRRLSPSTPVKTKKRPIKRLTPDVLGSGMANRAGQALKSRRQRIDEAVDY